MVTFCCWCSGCRAPAAGIGSGPAGGRGGREGEAGRAAHRCPAAAGGKDDGPEGLPAQGREPAGDGASAASVSLALALHSQPGAQGCFPAAHILASLLYFILSQLVGNLDTGCVLVLGWAQTALVATLLWLLPLQPRD